MPFLFAIILGVFIVQNSNSPLKKSQQNEKINQTISNKTTETKLVVPEVKLESIKKEVKVETKEPELINEPILIKEEVKAEIKEPDLIKEEVKAETKEPELIKEDIKLSPVQEQTKEIDNFNDTGVDWLKLIFYVLGALLITASGTYLYKKLRSKSSSGSSNDYLRREFREETQAETTERQPAQDKIQEETQVETTEEQPAQDKIQEETQVETTEEQPAQDKIQEETQVESTQEQLDEENENNNK
jgi:hypothetical protein